MARQAKDIAKRLRFHLFPRPDTFRRRFFLVGLAAALAGVALWFAFNGAYGERQYLPEVVSSSHATFGDRCENCHDDFQPVANGKCLTCHAPRVHSEFEADTPACRVCHVEHRKDDVFLSVGAASCTDCHASLASKRSPPGVQAHVASFADHPEFAALRDGAKDPAALRFNHRIHLTSDKVPQNDRLECSKCHVPAADGRYMQPIVFETHCERCHEQKVSELPYPISDLKAPHEAPEIVHESLTTGLTAMGVLRADEIFTPGAQIVGRVQREPIDESRTIVAFKTKRLRELEEALYRPFDEATPLLENNKYCFLCHVEAKPAAGGALPEVAATNVPERWLAHGEFSHRRHDKIGCENCHAGMDESSATADVKLPRQELCESCHADGTEQSAGTNCMLCHVYHDTTKQPELRRPREHEQSIEALLGSAALRVAE